MNAGVIRRLCACLLLFSAPLSMHGSAYSGNPKLVVILVLDQFRGDFLERYRQDLKPDGFRLLLDKGAYFPNCYYQYASLMTAPGHTTIATGTYSDMHGIAENEWWDLKRNTQRPVTSVEDDQFKLLTPSGSTAMGSSPRNLKSSTIGDEVRLATRGESRLFGVSLKDRSAILLSGQTANAAYWIDPATGVFVTSTYYMPQLPEWTSVYSQRAAQLIAKNPLAGGQNFYRQIGATTAGVEYEIGFAEELIRRENLGHHETADVLTISISSTDILGHRVGPDSEELRKLIVGIDGELASFFSFLDKQIDGGLGSTWITLTGDHGVAPEPGLAAKLGVNARRLELDRLIATVNRNLNLRYSRGANKTYLFPDQELPYLSMSEPAFTAIGMKEAAAEQAVADGIANAIKADPSLYAATVRRGKSTTAPAGFEVYTRAQIASNQLPPTELRSLLEHSYSTEIGWYDMMILDPFAMEQDEDKGIHYGPWSYDRHVPLAFYGNAFVAGIYPEMVEPTDLAVTLAAALKVNLPSGSEGKVLKQAMRGDAEAPQ